MYGVTYNLRTCDDAKNVLSSYVYVFILLVAASFALSVALSLSISLFMTSWCRALSVLAITVVYETHMSYLYTGLERASPGSLYNSGSEEDMVCDWHQREALSLVSVAVYA